MAHISLRLRKNRRKTQRGGENCSSHQAWSRQKTTRATRRRQTTRPRSIPLLSGIKRRARKRQNRLSQSLHLLKATTKMRLLKIQMRLRQLQSKSLSRSTPLLKIKRKRLKSQRKMLSMTGRMLT